MTAAGGTVVEMLARAAEQAHPGGLLIAASEQFQFVTWREVAAQACRAADALAERGVVPGERVALAAGNSRDWIVADLAIQMLGGVVVPLHASVTGQQLAWQLQHSGSRLLIVDGSDAAHKLTAAANELPAELQLAAFSEAADPRDLNRALPLWSDWLASANEAAGRRRWEQTLAACGPETLASIVYTSGTSGEPKGVMLTQGNLAANAQSVAEGFGYSSADCRLNSLPLSHAYARMSDLYVSLFASSRLALCRQRETLVADAQVVRPTLLVVVPLQLTRLRTAAETHFGADDDRAMQKLLGGQLRGFICGGAALAEEHHDFFNRQGTPVWEGYGLTEASPVVTLSAPNAQRRNTVGRAIPGTELRVASDGELLVRGAHVMAGYWQDPAATAETVRDGWLHTGDLANIDADGFVSLCGRAKEFIALASGKKVWPALLEKEFAQDPLIRQLMIVGEAQPALGALVVLQDSCPADRQRVLEHIAERLRGFTPHEQVRRVWLLTEPWTVEREELTPKLTLRRSVILRRYADCVRRMYSEE
jgi:long-chain acyl-CoA synthetase